MAAMADGPFARARFDGMIERVAVRAGNEVVEAYVQPAAKVPGPEFPAALGPGQPACAPGIRIAVTSAMKKGK